MLIFLMYFYFNLKQQRFWFPITAKGAEFRSVRFRSLRIKIIEMYLVNCHRY